MSWKKIKEGAKKYGWIVLLLVGAILLLFVGQTDKSKELWDKLQQIRGKSEEETKVVKENSNKLKKEMQENYQDALKEIREAEEKYGKQHKKVMEMKRKLIRDVVNAFKDDPDKTTKEIAEKHGWEYVEAKPKKEKEESDS